MHSLLRTLTDHGVPSVAAKAILVVALFAVASIISRLVGVVVGRLRARVEAISLDSPLVAIAQRETAVALAQTTVRYVVFFVALVLAITTIAGANTISTVAGASFVAVIIGFAAQRFLIDLMAGFVMFFEGWYTVGSMIVIEPMKLEGVVEDVSLRATKLRDVSGEILRVHNSQILAVRVLPDGGRHVQIELFVRDAEAGERLIETVAKLVPAGPTAFVTPPHVTHVDPLDDELHRVFAEATVAIGRSWMAEDLLPSLLRERAGDDLIVHGPVILPADEHAESRFARVNRFRQLQQRGTRRARASSRPER
ncbi:MAG TPA: mechanosensitive ion channel domain-containing protein [Gaiellaceae bacterium]|nr:mechanosensitive ion channel domain-containing protein [Gaiellaceae bacterium]